MTPRKQCLPDRTGLMHLWAYRDSDSMPQTWIGSTQHWEKEVHVQPHAYPRSPLQLVPLGQGKSVLSSGVSLGISTTVQDRPHAHSWPTQNGHQSQLFKWVLGVQMWVLSLLLAPQTFSVSHFPSVFSSFCDRVSLCSYSWPRKRHVALQSWQHFSLSLLRLQAWAILSVKSSPQRLTEISQRSLPVQLQILSRVFVCSFSLQPKFPS